MINDTIVAIATALGEGAIGVIRLSGEEAIPIASKLFRGKDLEQVASHTISYGKLIDPTTNEVFEEVLVSVMRAPKTFTKEDVVEINCHGGIASVQRVLALLLENGARLSEPGEFTKRAFLNGRIDLSQAEAVMDLIRAKTDEAMDVAVGQLEGRLSTLIKQLRQTIIETLAHVEVNIDYPEYDDVEEMTQEEILPRINKVSQEIENLLATARQGKIFREGLQTAIIGRPNVGKSSILNHLLQEKKAIVTDIAGTTRDVIEEYVNVQGVPLKLLDTAGIRETKDVVEQIGVERSKKAIKDADLVLLVLNGAEGILNEDIELFNITSDKRRIILVNKMDLQSKIDKEQLLSLANSSTIVYTSAQELNGLHSFEKALRDYFYEGKLQAKDGTYVSNARHIALLKQAKQTLEDAKNAAEIGMPIDLIQIDLHKSWELLGEIIGDAVHESLINELFSQFCLGK